jgi:hypothetical protein
MLVKWIVAEASDRAAFDQAQRRWAELIRYDGFMGQVGGWIHPFPAKAGILAVWRDPGTYRRFMETDHDDLTKPQSETYARIETSVPL